MAKVGSYSFVVITLLLVCTFLFQDPGKTPDSLEQLSQILEPLQKIHVLVKRMRDVIVLTLRQLSGILSRGCYTSNSTPSFPVCEFIFSITILVSILFCRKFYTCLLIY